MKMDSAWKTAGGTGVTIAFIDSGISAELYEANSDRIVAPHNVLEQNSDVTDELGHGTAMISAACCDKESGIFGIAPEAGIMPIEATNEYGLVAPESLAQGIYWAVDHDADVICLSLGSHLYNESVADSIDYANSRNVIVVAAAGDYSEKDLLFPASMSNVIAVASEDKDGDLCDFSSYSENKSTFLIPGDDIETLSIDEDGNTVIKRSHGTSVSCAIMAGIIALGLEVVPDASVDLLTDSLNGADQGKSIDVREFLNTMATARERFPLTPSLLLSPSPEHQGIAPGWWKRSLEGTLLQQTALLGSSSMEHIQRFLTNCYSPDSARDSKRFWRW
jgi:subtilisin family serine protease